MFAQDPRLDLEEGLERGERAFTGYFEAQVWGEIDLRDIKEFRVPEGIHPDRLKLLKLTGIPVYEIKETRKHGRFFRARGKLIDAGKPELRRQVRTRGRGRIDAKKVRKIEFNQSPDLTRLTRLDEGLRFRTPGNGQYTVQEVLGTGTREARYLVVTPDGQRALLRQGGDILQQGRDLGFTSSTLESGPGYEVLKYQDPHLTAGREIVSFHLHPGSETDRNLSAKFRDWARRGIFIEDLGPDWFFLDPDTREWSVLPPLDHRELTVRTGLTPEEAERRYQDLFERKWKKPFGGDAGLWKGDQYFKDFKTFIFSNRPESVKDCLVRIIRTPGTPLRRNLKASP